MLKKVLETEVIQYLLRSELTDYLGVYHPEIPVPYGEAFAGVHALFVIPASDSVSTQPKIYVELAMTRYYWPGWHYGIWRWDGENLWAKDAVKGRTYYGFGVEFWGGTRSRLGVYYWISYNAAELRGFSWTPYAVAPESEAEPFHLTNPTAGNTFPATFDGPVIPASRFGFLQYGRVAVDDSEDRLIHRRDTGRTLDVYVLSTGELLYSVVFPQFITEMCLEDSARVYVLMNNRILVLFDYLRGDTLGAVRLPSEAGNHYWSDESIYSIRMAWDNVSRRLYTVEGQADNVDGTSNIKVVGYRTVPLPTRVTTPIPLRSPRQRRIIPVLASIFGDMNEGVGGYIVRSVVTGSGSLAGVPTTNASGHSLTPVALEGHAGYVGDEDALEVGNPDDDPPNVGYVNIECSITVPAVYAAPPTDVPDDPDEEEPTEPGDRGQQEDITCP